MMNEINKPNSVDGVTELEVHFGRYIDRMLAGEVVDLEQVRQDHPEFGDALVKQLRSFQDLSDTSPGGDLSASTLGDYTVIRKTGQGGMGVVYEAWQNSLNRQVALKVLPAYVARSANAATRFIREAQIAARLSHPNIVPVFGMGVERHVPYYAMEFVEGETLRDFISKMRALDPDDRRMFSSANRTTRSTGSRHSTETSTLGQTSEGTNTTTSDREPRDYCQRVADYFVGVADGLHHAHRQGVTHRDIKPSNLIFDRRTDDVPASQTRLRILDFGLASFEGQESLTATGELLGTIRYMSPEQASHRQAKQLDHRTDIYSLGVTLYEALTLQPAFPEGDVRETISRIIESEPIAPRRLNPRISRDLETIILKCMRKEPKARYASAAELAEDLRRHASGKPILARPQTRQERVVRWCRNNAGLATALAALSLLLIAGFLGVSYAAVHARRQEEEQRRLAYAVGVQFVDRLANDDNGTSQQIRSQLETHRPQAPGDADYRDFAWYYHWNLLENITPVYQDLGAAPQVALSKNGNLLSLAKDLVVKEWGASSTIPIRTTPLVREVHSSTFRLSPDGRTAAVLVGGDSVQVFQTTDGKLLQRFEIPSNSRRIQFVYSPDGKWLMARLQRIPTPSPDKDDLSGALSNTGLEMEDRVWDVATGDLVHQRRFAGPKHDKPNRQPEVPILSDSKTVLDRNEEEGLVRIQRDEPVGVLYHIYFYVHSHAVSLDGKLCAVGDVRGMVMLWDISSQKLIREFRADEVSITAIAFSPDGAQLATGGYRGKITLWDVGTGQKRSTLKARTGMIQQLSFSEDMDQLLSLDWSGVARVWDLDTLGDTGFRIQKLTENGTGKCGYSPDGKWLPVIQRQTVELWTTHPMRRVHQLADSSAFCTEFTPDSKTLLVGNRDGVVQFWDVETGQQRTERSLEELTPQAGTTFTVNSLSVSPDGRYLAASFGWPHEDDRPASPKDVTVWSLETGKVVATLPHPNRVMKVAFSPDANSLATACYDGGLRLWETTAWQQTHLLQDQGKASPGLMSLAFRSHAQQEHVAVGDFIGRIHLWDLNTRTKIKTLPGHPTQCIDLEFSPDKRVLASGSYDGTVRIWDWSTGRQLCVLRGHHGSWVSSVSFAPDGATLTTQSFAYGIARQWPTKPSFWRDADHAVSELEKIRRASPYEPFGLSLVQTARQHPEVWRMLAERLPDDPVVMIGLSRVHDDAGDQEEAFETRQRAIDRLSPVVNKDLTNVPLTEVMTDLLLEHVASQIEWSVAKPTRAERDMGDPLTILSDGTVVVDGDATFPERFVLQASADLAKISALAIDTIPDPAYGYRPNMTPAFQFEVELYDSNAAPSGSSVRPHSMMVGWTGKRVLPGLTIENEASETAHICLTNFVYPASIVIATQPVQNATPGDSLKWHFRTRPLHGTLRIKTTSHPDAYFYEWLTNDRELAPIIRLATAYFLVGEWQKSLEILRSLEKGHETAFAKLLIALCLSKLGEHDEASAEYRAAAAQLDAETPTVGLSLLARIVATQFSNSTANDTHRGSTTNSLDRQLEEIESRIGDVTMQPWDPWLYLQCLEARFDLGLGLSQRHLEYASKIVDLSQNQADFQQAMSTLELMLRSQADLEGPAPQELDRIRFQLWQVRTRLPSDMHKDGLLSHHLNHPLYEVGMAETSDGSQVNFSDVLRGPVVTLFIGPDPTLPTWQLDRIHQLQNEYQQAGLKIVLVTPSESSLGKLREQHSIPDDWIVLIHDIPTLADDPIFALLTIDGKFDASIVSWWLLESEVHRWFREAAETKTELDSGNSFETESQEGHRAP